MNRIFKHLKLSRKETRVLRQLSSYRKIQAYLDRLSINFESKGDTVCSPRKILREQRAHCIEGALLASVAFWYHGDRPLLLDLMSADHDVDHVVAMFRKHGHWGAISKTNHAVLRYREPIYRSVRELAMSYFHEYFTDDGRKTLRSYSDPFDLSKIKDTSWITSEKNLWHIVDLLNEHPHHQILNRSMIAGLRKADPIERKAGKLVERKNHR